MGFLLGAFGKLAAKQRARDIQAQLMRVQSRLRIASRQVANVTKMLENQKKADLNALNSQFAMMRYSLPNSVLQNDQLKDFDMNNPTQVALYQQEMAKVQAQMEAQKSMMEQQITDKYEFMNDMMLEPLKMEEEALQLEKDSLETQLKIAEADAKACEQMEDAAAKDLAPKYVAGGGG